MSPHYFGLQTKEFSLELDVMTISPIDPTSARTESSTPKMALKHQCARSLHLGAVSPYFLFHIMIGMIKTVGELSAVVIEDKSSKKGR